MCYCGQSHTAGGGGGGGEGSLMGRGVVVDPSNRNNRL